MKYFSIIFFIFFAAVIALQLFPVQKNVSQVSAGKSFEHSYTVPRNVAAILAESCYDCHSNNTRYPLYSKVQPLAWFLAQHIYKGKQELNFDDFTNYSARRKKAKIRSIISQVQEDKMPLSSYKMLHSGADLTEQEKKILISYFRSF